MDRSFRFFAKVVKNFAMISGYFAKLVSKIQEFLRKNFKNFKETNMEDLCFKTSLQAASV